MNILEVHHVYKRFASQTALTDVSISIPKGCIYGLLGPNGAGKTTLIRIITQITAPDEGEVLFNGEHMKPSAIYEIGYLPEERGLYKKMEVGEQLLYFARLKGLSRNDAMIKLRDWVERFEIKSWWKKKVEELSKGMQQKIQFIATVLHEPKLIILDEPFSGFDPINAGLITDEILRLKEQGSSIIFSTHRMESVEQLCDHIALINKSRKVLEGSVKDVRDRFRTNTFELEYSGNRIQLPEGFEMIETSEHISDFNHCTIKIAPPHQPNELLKYVIEHAEVHRFAEKLPSMQEIFVKVVSENSNEVLVG